MICKNCAGVMEQIDTYCAHCGTPNPLFQESFCVLDVLKEAQKESRQAPNYFGYFFCVGVMCLLAIFILTNISFGSEALHYCVLNVLYCLLIPLFIIPLSTLSQQQSLITAFRYYPKLVGVVFFFCLYLLFLKLICRGDPILNIVRFILILWGLAIIFPIPFLVFHDPDSVVKIIIKAYRAGKYLRWHQFFLGLVLALLNCGGAILLLIYFPKSMMYTGRVMSLWYQKQHEYRLFNRAQSTLGT